MKKIINRKNAVAVACAAMMICAAGAVPDSVLSVSMPVQAAEAAVQTSLPQVTGLTSKTPDSRNTDNDTKHSKKRAYLM